MRKDQKQTRKDPLKQILLSILQADPPNSCYELNAYVPTGS